MPLDEESEPSAPNSKVELRPGKLAGCGAWVILAGVIALGASIGTCDRLPRGDPHSIGPADSHLAYPLLLLGLAGLALMGIGALLGVAGLAGLVKRNSTRRDD